MAGLQRAVASVGGGLAILGVAGGALLAYRGHRQLHDELADKRATTALLAALEVALGHADALVAAAAPRAEGDGPSPALWRAAALDLFVPLHELPAFDPRSATLLIDAEEQLAACLAVDTCHATEVAGWRPENALETLHPVEAVAAAMQELLRTERDAAKLRLARHEDALVLTARQGADLVLALGLSAALLALGAAAVIEITFERRKRNEAALRRLKLVLDSAAAPLLVTDTKGRIEFANRAAEEVVGEWRRLSDSGSPGLAGQASPEAFGELQRALAGGASIPDTLRVTLKNGETAVLSPSVSPLQDTQGTTRHHVASLKDVTQEVGLRERLAFVARHDPLTDLATRALFIGWLESAVESARASGVCLALVVVDIDRFKDINDLSGFGPGDLVLQSMSRRLRKVVGEESAARLGSDEFGAIFPTLAGPDAAMVAVEELLTTMHLPVALDGESLRVTLSAGVAVFPRDGEDGDTLLKHADLALQRAKRMGRSSCEVHDASAVSRAVEHAQMERQLFQALQRDEFEITYQPYADLTDGKVVGAEALLTWRSPSGPVPPSRFIPLLEETGLIIDVGSWVLRKVCGRLGERGHGPRVPVAVNLSAIQFHESRMVERIKGLLDEFNVDASLLTLEITESMMVRDPSSARRALAELKTLGVSTSVDDFGTGFSSLSQLKSFPLDYVKIDIAFVRDVTTDPSAASLVSTIVNMAHGLGMRTIAEGVETLEQWKVLHLLQCDMAQGYHLSHPLGEPDFDAYMVKQQLARVSLEAH